MRGSAGRFWSRVRHGSTDTAQSTTITGTVSNLTSGTAYFGICIDAVAGESDTGNNCSQGVRVIVGGSGAPDLVVSLSKASVTVSPGDSFSYDVTIRNQGDATSATTRWRTFQSGNATISPTDDQIGQPVTVPALPPSAEVTGIRTGGGGASDTTYTTGQTIETLPTGFWVPDQAGGGVDFQFSNGVATVTLSGTSSYIVENNIRYSCLSSGGCEIVNRRVTKGSIRARTQSSGSLIAEPQWDGLLQATGTGGTVIRLRRGEDPPAARGAAEAVLRIKPGTEPEDEGRNPF